MGYKKWSVTEGDAPGFGGVEGIAPMVISSVASALGAVVGVKLLGGLSEHARDRRRSRPNTPRQSVGDAASPAGAALPSKKPQIFKPRRRPRNAAHWSPDDSTTAVVTAAGATRPKVQLIANAATCAKVVDVALVDFGLVGLVGLRDVHFAWDGSHPLAQTRRFMFANRLSLCAARGL